MPKTASAGWLDQLGSNTNTPAVRPKLTAGRAVWRGGVVIAVVALIEWVPVARHALLLPLVALRNWVAGHTTHPGRPMSAGRWPHHLYAHTHSGAIMAGTAVAVVAIAIGLQVQGLRTYGRNALAVRVVGLTVAGLVAVALVVAGLAAWSPGAGEAAQQAITKLLTSLVTGIQELAAR